MCFATLTLMNVPASLVSTVANVLTGSTHFTASAQKVFLVTSVKWTLMNVPAHHARMELNAPMVPISTHASVQKAIQDSIVRLISMSATLTLAIMGPAKMDWLPLHVTVAQDILAACVRQTSMNASANHAKMEEPARTGRTRIFVPAPKELQVLTVR